MNTNRKRLVTVVASAFIAALPAWAAAAEVPLVGRAEGAVTSLAPAPDGVVLTVLAQGKASHLGIFTREERIVLDPVANTFTGTMVFTAANGDRLAGTLEGAFVAPGSATGTYAFSGGTGRFAQVSGYADFVLATPDGLRFTVGFAGSIDR
jgi:hypothetical protein